MHIFLKNVMQDDHVRYPIGRYSQPNEITEQHIAQWIDEVAALPAMLRATVAGLSADQLDTPYREGGWTVRQVVHHLPDSHMNAYIRFKLALTEERPVIKPYRENLWAELADSHRMPPEASLSILEGLHARWVTLVKAMAPSDYKRTFFHPEHQKEFALDAILGMYAWHGKHHRAQIVSLKERMQW